MVYIYQAALLCEECGAKVRAELTAAGNAPADPEDECSYDSDDFPKGPQDEGESDTPSHCDACGCFLESELTDEGQRYVREKVEDAIIAGKADSVALQEWAPFYGIEPEDPRAVRLARMTPAIRALADDKGELPCYAWPGGYPIFYVTERACDVVCCKCANDASTGVDAFGGEKIGAHDVNWEDPDLWCECGERVESAYAEDDAEESDGAS